MVVVVELVEVVVDNLEYDLYDVPSITIAKSVLLAWSENTMNEQIIVGASALESAVWTPWPEPVFNHRGFVSLAVPTSATQQFFKLVPGVQFLDDFKPLPQWPYTARGEWIPYFGNSTDAARAGCRGR